MSFCYVEGKKISPLRNKRGGAVPFFWALGGEKKRRGKVAFWGFLPASRPGQTGKGGKAQAFGVRRKRATCFQKNFSTNLKRRKKKKSYRNWPWCAKENPAQNRFLGGKKREGPQCTYRDEGERGDREISTPGIGERRKKDAL